MDDFIIFNKNKRVCFKDLQTLLKLCDELNVPVNHEKTVLPSTVVHVHGIEIDTGLMIARLPEEKLEKARFHIKRLSLRKKVCLKELQEALGFLNFACKVIKPGRTFLRRLINLTIGVEKPFYKIRLTKEARADLKMWTYFLQHYNGVSILVKQVWETSEKLHLYTDAAASVGFAAIFGNKWCLGLFSDQEKLLHITVLEIYPLALAIMMWSHYFTNRCIVFHCDNQSVVEIINKQTSKDLNIMRILRELVLCCLNNNIMFRAKHIPGIENNVADALSRSQVHLAHQLQPNLDQHPTAFPKTLELSRLLQNS